MRSKPSSFDSTTFGQIYSKFNRFKYGEGFRADESWATWYWSTVRCNCCAFPTAKHQLEPTPIEPVLIGAFQGTSGGTTACPVTFYREDLCAVLAEWIPEAVWGQCLHRQGATEQKLPFFTLQVPRRSQAYPHRGLTQFDAQSETGHYACPGRGRIQEFGSSSEAFVEADIRQREVVVDCNGDVFVSKPLAADLKLRQRVPDLRLYKIPVLKEPADGWTLPNDPGWDGTLRPPPGVGQVPDFPCYQPGQRPRWFPPPAPRRVRETVRE